jgi:hypothetical protein
VVNPHGDIRQGRFDAPVFAADLGEVARVRNVRIRKEILKEMRAAYGEEIGVTASQQLTRS